MALYLGSTSIIPHGADGVWTVSTLSGALTSRGPDMALYYGSTTVIPHGAEGVWTVSTLSSQEAADVAKAEPFVSVVGHESSAEAMTSFLGVPVAVNRITIQPKTGDRFLCFRLIGRAPEWSILDRLGLGAIGFSWALLAYEG